MKYHCLYCWRTTPSLTWFGRLWKQVHDIRARRARFYWSTWKHTLEWITCFLKSPSQLPLRKCVRPSLFNSTEYRCGSMSNHEQSFHVSVRLKLWLITIKYYHYICIIFKHILYWNWNCPLSKCLNFVWKGQVFGLHCFSIPQVHYTI